MKYISNNDRYTKKMRHVSTLHTTELGVQRIRRNLNLDVDNVVEWCQQAVLSASADAITRKGKNWYVSGNGFVLTINAHSHTIITAHKVGK